MRNATAKYAKVHKYVHASVRTARGTPEKSGNIHMAYILHLCKVRICVCMSYIERRVNIVRRERFRRRRMDHVNAEKIYVNAKKNIRAVYGIRVISKCGGANSIKLSIACSFFK